MTLRNHIREAARIREHLVLALTANKVIGDEALLLRVARLLVALVARWCRRGIRLILRLPLDIHRRLRSYPILRRG